MQQYNWIFEGFHLNWDNVFCRDRRTETPWNLFQNVYWSNSGELSVTLGLRGAENRQDRIKKLRYIWWNFNATWNISLFSWDVNILCSVLNLSLCYCVDFCSLLYIEKKLTCFFLLKYQCLNKWVTLLFNLETIYLVTRIYKINRPLATLWLKVNLF